MRTQFQINSSIIQPQVCVEQSNFQDGQIPQVIKVTYRVKQEYAERIYSYHFNHRDANGNFCYRLVQMLGAFGRKKKKAVPPTPPPLLCTKLNFFPFCQICYSNLVGVINDGDNILANNGATGIATTILTQTCAGTGVVVQTTSGDFTGATSFIDTTSGATADIDSVDCTLFLPSIGEILFADTNLFEGTLSNIVGNTFTFINTNGNAVVSGEYVHNLAFDKFVIADGILYQAPC